MRAVSFATAAANVVEAARVIPAVPADQAHARAVLVREDSPAVHLLLVDPAVAVERLADKRRGHWRVLRDHELSFYLRLWRSGKASGEARRKKKGPANV